MIEKLIKKLFREYNLKFHELMKRDTYVYVWKKHPLAKREKLSLKEAQRLFPTPKRNRD